MQVNNRETDVDDFAKAHWINTSLNSIVQNLIGRADEKVKAQIESLINGGRIEAPLKETITYGKWTVYVKIYGVFFIFPDI